MKTFVRASVVFSCALIFGAAMMQLPEPFGQECAELVIVGLVGVLIVEMDGRTKP